MMRFRTQRIRQGLISLLAILSMSASSMAACACSHHGQAHEPETKSCHSTSSEQHHSQEASDHNTDISFQDSCFCVQPSVDTSVKAEAFKFHKAPSASSATLNLEQVLFSSVVPNSTRVSSAVIRAKRFAASKSTRGPPSL